MCRFRAVGFDLFNTLITIEEEALETAIHTLTRKLQFEGFAITSQDFNSVYTNAALSFIREAKQSHRETHNRFWISGALDKFGYSVDPEDPRIIRSVEQYFASFLEYSKLIPGTTEMLSELAQNYKLGLLSNFTDGAAARNLLNHLGLTRFFSSLLISGELGYRKPNPFVFDALAESLQVRPWEVMYIGDDPEADVQGALNSGMQPVWTTYVRDNNVSFAPGVDQNLKEPPEQNIPKISHWQELLEYLNHPLPE